MPICSYSTARSSRLVDQHHAAHDQGDAADLLHAERLAEKIVPSTATIA